MTSKQKEREALEQIMRIVDSLGENSYIATAFEGCFEIAEENIKFDMACSMKNRKEAAEAAEDILRKKVAEQKELLKTVEAQRNTAGLERDEARRVNDILRNRAELAEETMRKEAERANSLAAKLSDRNDEIIRLKARLYDLMSA